MLASNSGTLRVLVFSLLFAAVGCDLSRTFDVRGRIVGFGDDGRTVLIEHEEVPGFMPAMTMPFRTVEQGVLEDVDEGMAVQFALHVSRDSAWITGLQVLPDDALPAHPAGSDDPAVGRAPDVPLLESGDAAPSFTLVDQDADTLRLADYDGRALLLTFIYTRCPLPEYCPLMAQRFRTLQPRLVDAYGARAQLLSVSFDPAYDTPEVLSEYAGRFGADPTVWTFATGTTEEIDRLTAPFGVFYNEGQGQFTHNLTTALVAPDGRVERIWRGNGWTTDEVLAAVRDVLEGAST